MPQVSWGSLFTAVKETCLCPSCQNQLIEIEGRMCTICSRPLDKLDPQYVQGEHCYDCVRWEKDPEWKGYLSQNISLYKYNDFLKELISQYKFRGDYILAKAFADKIRKKLEGLNFNHIVPVPLSKERQFERGFNQSEALIREAGLTPTNLLKRTHGEKQSKKSRNDRIHLPQVFQIEEQVEVYGKSILIIDDIYTTGSTLRHAAKILKLNGANTISSLTIARG